VFYGTSTHDRSICADLSGGFANDTRIVAAVADTNAIELLRSDIRRLYEWSNDWLMIFNIDKCKVLHFGVNNAKYVMLGDQDLDSVLIE